MPGGEESQLSLVNSQLLIREEAILPHRRMTHDSSIGCGASSVFVKISSAPGPVSSVLSVWWV